MYTLVSCNDRAGHTSSPTLWPQMRRNQLSSNAFWFPCCATPPASPRFGLLGSVQWVRCCRSVAAIRLDGYHPLQYFRGLLLYGENTADKLGAVRSLVGEVAAVGQLGVTVLAVPGVKRAESVSQSEDPPMAAIGLTQSTRHGFTGPKLAQGLNSSLSSVSMDRDGPVFVVLEVDRGDDDSAQRLAQFLDRLLPPLRQSVGVVLLMDGVPEDAPCTLRRHIDCHVREVCWPICPAVWPVMICQTQHL